MQIHQETCLRQNNIQKINQKYTNIYRKLNQNQAFRLRGTSLNEEACASWDESCASSDEACALSMRHTPHQPMLELLVYSKHKNIQFQAIKTHFYAIKRKYTLTTPYLHVHTIIFTPNKQWKPQINKEIKK